MDKEEIIIFCKKMEIKALETAKGWEDNPNAYHLWSGKAQAFSQVWEFLVFDGKSVPSGEISPQEYNKMNEYWSKRIRK